MSKAPTRPKAKAPLSSSTDEWIGQWFTYLDSRLTAIFTALGTLTSEVKMVDQAETDLQTAFTNLSNFFTQTLAPGIAALQNQVATLTTQIANGQADAALVEQVAQGLTGLQTAAANALNPPAPPAPPSGS